MSGESGGRVARARRHLRIGGCVAVPNRKNRGARAASLDIGLAGQLSGGCHMVVDVGSDVAVNVVSAMWAPATGPMCGNVAKVRAQLGQSSRQGVSKALPAKLPWGIGRALRTSRCCRRSSRRVPGLWGSSERVGASTFSKSTTFPGALPNPGTSRELVRQLLEACKARPTPLGNFPGNLF